MTSCVFHVSETGKQLRLESADTQQLLNRDTFDVEGTGFSRRWEKDSANTSRAQWDFWWLDTSWPLLTPSKLLRAAVTSQRNTGSSCLPPQQPPELGLSSGEAPQGNAGQAPHAHQTTSVTLEGPFILWSHAEITGELKQRTQTLYTHLKHQGCHVKIPKSEHFLNIPGFHELSQSKLLQAPQAGPALQLPLLKKW